MPRRPFVRIETLQERWQESPFTGGLLGIVSVALATAAIGAVPPSDPGDLGTLSARRPPAHVTGDAVEQMLQRMRERAAVDGPNASLGTWKDVRAFFRSGGSGEWRERVSAADLAAYEARVAQLAGPDLAAWAARVSPPSRGAPPRRRTDNRHPLDLHRPDARP